MIDNGEADEKIVAVLENDTVWKNARDISDVPEAYIERLRHYFNSYKRGPDMEANTTFIVETYGQREAFGVVRAAMEDYADHFGVLETPRPTRSPQEEG